MQRWTVPELTPIGQLHPSKGLSQTPRWLGDPHMSPSPASLMQHQVFWGEKKPGGRDSQHTILLSQAASTPPSLRALQVGVTPGSTCATTHSTPQTRGAGHHGAQGHQGQKKSCTQIQDAEGSGSADIKRCMGWFHLRAPVSGCQESTAYRTATM